MIGDCILPLLGVEFFFGGGGVGGGNRGIVKGEGAWGMIYQEWNQCKCD